MGTSVLTPTLRYNPSIIAQAFGTLGALAPGRVFLGVGTGESLNETPATGGEFPGAKERRRRLAEAVNLIEQLWREERVDFEGEYYEARRATIYDKPEDPVPIFIAASGPLAAKLAGRRGDGFISTSGKDPDLYRELIANLAEGAEKAERDPAEIRKMIEIKVSYDRNVDEAFESCKLWSALGLSHEQKAGIDDPIEMERVADENADKAHNRFIVSCDPDEVIEKIMPYVELGFEDLVLHAPGRRSEALPRPVLRRRPAGAARGGRRSAPPSRASSGRSASGGGARCGRSAGVAERRIGLRVRETVLPSSRGIATVGSRPIRSAKAKAAPRSLTWPAGTRRSSSAAAQAAAGRAASRRSSSAPSASRCSTRAGLVAKRGSVASSGAPSSSQSAANWRSLPTARTSSLSPVA